MKIQIMSYEEAETAAHEANEARYTKMKEGEFVGEIPVSYGNVGGGLYTGDMKKKRDPVEESEYGA